MNRKLYFFSCIFFCLITALFSVLQAQELNTLTVNVPSGISGDYRIARALFGSQSNDTISAGAFFGSPTQGCTTLTGDGSGKVVFLDRGTCAFDVKSLNAQNSGAVAVVICAVLPNETLQMMPGGNVADQVTIPVFYASKETCDKLRIDLTSGGIQVTFKNKVCPTSVSYASNVVWGDAPGEGDFRNGFGGWTTDKGWVHNPEGVIRNGAYTEGPKVVGSETYCTGVAEFNSDFLDNAGMTLPDGSPDRGKGTCPSPCTGFLLSPNIVFNKPLEQGLIIEFSQSLRQFRSEYYIMVSKDGGTTFADTFRLNEEYRVNSNHISERKKISFVGYKGANQIRFKFECIGDYYYWAIDDVVVYDDSFVDLQINREWYSVAPYYKMPKSMISEIPFMASINNNGNVDSENTLLKVQINGPDVNQTIDFPLPVVGADNSLLNTVLPLRYVLPDSRTGTYSAEYIIENNLKDLNPDNNKAGFQWKVTENTFGTLDNEEEFGSPYMYYYVGWSMLPAPKIYSCANIYYVPEGTPPGYLFTKARYGFENSLSTIDGQSIRLDLFEWNDLDNSGTSSPTERKRVGCNYQIINSDIPNLRSIETDIWVSDAEGLPIEGERVFLKENTHYLISASVTPANPETNPEMQLLGFIPKNLDNYGRSIGAISATNFALDSLESLGLISSRVSGSIYAFENINDTSVEDIDNRNYRFISNGNSYTKIFLELDIEVTTDNTSETILPAKAIKTFPNPAARDLFINLALENVSENVEVSMFDIEGRLASTKTFNNIKEDRLRVDISTLNNGVYNVRIVTSEGTATRKVIVQN